MGSGELGSRERLRVVRVARSLVGRSWTGDALGGSGCWCSGSWGVVFGVVILGRRRPGQPRLPRDPPCAWGSEVAADRERIAWWRCPVGGIGSRRRRGRVGSRGLL